MLFSVIIPAYNSAVYIEETLRSISGQSFKNVEVLVIDDGSTDNTYELSRSLFSSLALKGNVYKRPDSYTKGVSSCRNYGIEKSAGEWLCFVDSDDVFHPSKLNILEELVSILDTSVKAIHHAPLNFDDGSVYQFPEIKDSITSVLTVKDISAELSCKNIICTSSVSMRKSLATQLGGFNNELHGVEDYYLWLNAAKNTQWAYLSFPLTAYRVRLGSLMGGRRMSYYIEQHNKLVTIAKQNKVFSASEIKNIENYFMKEVMNYYAMVSINNYGWSDFLKGLVKLTIKGYPMVAIRLLMRHGKFLILRTVSSWLKRT